MAEPKRPALKQRVLDKLLGANRHPDEGKIAVDVKPQPRIFSEVTADDARAAILDERNSALEQSLFESKMGRRTFPTAADVGGPPMMMGAEMLNAQTARRSLKMGQPFFTDPGSGEVDFNQPPLPWVIAEPSNARASHILNDRSTWPASVPRATGLLSHWIRNKLGLKD